MATPAEREFVTFRRGEIREGILREFREGLRLLPDPETGQEFTEDKLRRATMRGSRFWREADAVDLVGLGFQKRAEFLAQQTRIDRAGSGWLRNYHAPLWGETYLEAFGGSGHILASGIAGTTWQGSTTLADPFAQLALDSAGNRYQVVVTGSASGAGTASLLVLAIDGGEATNLPSGSVLRWVSPPPGSSGEATVTDDFSGGFAAETDADFAARLAARVRHKPASGNWAHFRAFAREASNAVEDAFVYPVAFHAGSVLIAVTRKRGDVTGPDARIPDINALTAVRSRLVPPGSPVVPGRVHVVVVPPVAEPTDLVVRLAQPLGSTAGWTDLSPFPPIDGTDAVAITLLDDQTHFEVTTSGAGQLPLGATSSSEVHLMVWDTSTSRFVVLAVETVEDTGAGVYAVTLATAPSKTLAVGDWISPEMGPRNDLAEGLVAYLDSLGPGEVIDLETDDRAVRCYRNPVPSEEYPARAGQSAITFISEALGTAVADATLASISVSTPSVPADPIDGPSLIVAGRFAVYSL